jgi:Ca2+-binding EF-hand superfamily protein
MTIEGQPFNVPREKLVDELLKQADTDGDGKPTWKEAISNPRFGFGPNRFRVVAVDVAVGRQAIDQQIALYDRNRDGLADRSEVRRYIATNSGGPAFTTAAGQTTSAKSAVRDFVDADGDRSLSSAEIGAVSEKLATRDADVNDVVTPAELGLENSSPVYRLGAGGAQPNLFVLGPAAQADPVYRSALYSTMVQFYGGKAADGLPIWSHLAAADLNGNGRFEASDVPLLDYVDPQLVINAQFDPLYGKQPWLTVVVAGLRDTKTHVGKDDTVTVELAGLKIDVSIKQLPPTANFAAQAEQLMARFDADKNQYLEKSELATNIIGRQFEQWDENGDGKVYAAEIESVYTRQMAPQRTQIAATATVDRDPLLSALDSSGDGRLGLRELRAAAAKLSSMDKNGDGAVAPDEVPNQLSLVLAHGGGNQAFGAPGVVVAARTSGAYTPPPQPARGTPEWFARMDRNNDGDLSPREFLGTPQQFKRLDADGDGLLDVKEAVAGNP